MSAPGVHPDSPLGRAGHEVTQRWLSNPKNLSTAVAFENSDALIRFQESEPPAPLPPGAFPPDADVDSAKRQTIVLLDDCTVLGGAEWPLRAGHRCRLHFRADDLAVMDGRTELLSVSYDSVTELELTGPGEVVSGGGFVGGGLGLDGAAAGILEATVLNALTTRRKVLAVIRLQADPAEAFFSHQGATPEQLRIKLSPVFAKIRQRPEAPADKTPSAAADRLLRLGEMVDRGLLSHDEFAQLKQQLLNDTGPG